MKLFILISMIIFGAFQMHAQDDQKRRKVYKIWVKLNNGETIKGYLAKLKDSSITVLYDDGAKRNDFMISNIRELKFRTKGRVGRGIGFGAAGGLLAGAAIGVSTGANSIFGSEGDATVAYGIGLIPIGAITGGFIGAIKKRYVISGNQDNYKLIKNELLEYEQSAE